MADIPSSDYDLVIRGGTVVTAGSSGECDLGISAGRIGQLGGPMRGRREIDAAGALVLPGALDPQLRRTIDGSSMRSKAGYSVYDGREVYGWPRFTVSRGEIVLEDGQVTGEPGRGQWLHRESAAAP